jgi:diaminopimelate epimerase
MTAFVKTSGSGNDFIALPEPAAEPTAAQIRSWCRRGVSLGADGVFTLRRGPAGAAAATEATPMTAAPEPKAAPATPTDTGATVSMAYYNADGLPAELCLNGTRCAAQLAFHLGWADAAVEVRTAAGGMRARRLDERRVTLELDLAVAAPRELAVEIDGMAHRGWSVTVGVPHFLLLWPGDLESAPVVALGRALRHHPLFAPAGTNVNFVRLDGRGNLALRTYERGVEDETLACGSGAVAAAALGLALGRLDPPVTVATRGGFGLLIDRDAASGRFSLAGDARIVASGELLAGAGD